METNLQRSTGLVFFTALLVFFLGSRNGFAQVMNDAELLRIVNPTNFSCGDSLMEVKVEIRNNGLSPITSMPVTAEISGDITTTLTHVYTGNLQQNETDTVVVGTLNTHQGAYLNLLCYTALPNDQFPQNDTIQIDSVYIFELAPLFSAAKICPGEDSVSLSVSSIPRVLHAWFDTLVGGTPIGYGDSIRVSRFSIPIYLAYLDIEDSLHTTFIGGNIQSGNMVDFVIHNSLNVYAFDMLPSAASTSAGFEVYYKLGSYQGFEQIDTAWTLLQSYTDQNVSAGVPHRLKLDTPVKLNGGGTTYSFYLTRTDASVRYTNGSNEYAVFTSNDDMDILEGIGVVYPFGSSIRPRIWNGTVIYGTEACSDVRIEADIDFGDTVFADFTWATVSHTVAFQSTSVNADSVKWYFAGLGTATGDSISFQFPETNSYEVCMVAFNDCGSDTICKLVWAENISVNEYDLASKLKLFPNPNNGSFTLGFQQELTGDLIIECIDLKGKTLMRDEIPNFSGTFSKSYQLNHLASGTYMIRLSAPNGVITRRIVVSR